MVGVRTAARGIFRKKPTGRRRVGTSGGRREPRPTRVSSNRSAVMPHYIFNAIPTDESTELCTQLANTCRRTARMTILRNTFASGRGKAIVRSLGLGALRSLTAADHLYVLMHGSGYGGTSNVGVSRGAVKEYERGQPKWVGGVLKKYGMAELARALHKEGLPAAFV